MTQSRPTGRKAKPFIDGFTLPPRTTIFGATGTGKSTMARRLIEGVDHRRIIILDPSLDWERELGDTAVNGRQGVADYLMQDRPGRRLIVTPGHDYAADVEWLARVVMIAQKAFLDGRASYKILLVFDEASEALPSRRDIGPHMRTLIARGRHSGVDMMAIAQRPSGVHADFRSNAAAKIFYPVYDAIDQKAVRQSIGTSGLDRLMNLPDYHAILRNKGAALVEVTA